MPDETVLRAKARAVVQAGELPARGPDRVWGGPGVGAPCEVCGLAITKHETELEIEFAHDGREVSTSSTSTSDASQPGSLSASARWSKGYDILRGLRP
jgi:hypothetical protein